MGRSYLDMREANTIGGDKYFHCEASHHHLPKMIKWLTIMAEVLGLQIRPRITVKHASHLDLMTTLSILR